MTKPEKGNIAQYRPDMKLYETYKCRDHIACILMLSSMRKDIMLHFERHHSTQVVWDAMKI